MNLANAFYAQSGGVTAVINATACGLIEAARQHPESIAKVYCGQNGIIGALTENLIDTSLESAEAIAALRYTPGGAFGSCRYQLKNIDQNRAEYERIIQVFKAHNIQYFFYNGGGDSQDTALKISAFSRSLDYPLICIGLPKTIDNDLPFTDTCPGFGSVAKYVAVSTREAGLDVASMASTSTKVFILEVMGRHAGWIAAASGLAASTPDAPPHIILFPEIPFDESVFCEHVDVCVNRFGYCVVVAAEGLKNKAGKLVAEQGSHDAFGHAQLGGVAPYLAAQVQQKLKLKYHWAVADYLQRSARHIASKVDVEQSYALGKRAVEMAVKGKTGIMLNLNRISNSPYQWEIGDVALEKVANAVRTLPANYITPDGYHITPACRDYLLPLIQGEDYPPYKAGLPAYVKLKNQLVTKKLEA